MIPITIGKFKGEGVLLVDDKSFDRGRNEIYNGFCLNVGRGSR